MGKTALVGCFLAGQKDLQVLSASGDEGEVALAYGVVDQLAAQLHAIASEALALPVLSGGPLPEAVSVGAELVGALGALQDEGPVALLLDDTQWADTPSL